MLLNELFFKCTYYIVFLFTFVQNIELYYLGILNNTMKRLVTIFISAFIALCSQAQTEKSQSVNLDLLGLQYNLEKPLSKKFTVNYHGGLVGELEYSKTSISTGPETIHDEYWGYTIKGIVGTDFRYYYNLASREAKGKNIRKNSGNFWAVDLQYITPAISSRNMNTNQIALISPYWGIRRVYRNNILFEFNLGYNFGIYESEWGGSPKIDLKIGYTF